MTQIKKEERTMIKSIFKSGVVFAFTGLLLLSCAHDPVLVNPEHETQEPEVTTPVFVLSAALPDADTKTILSADDGEGNFDILWKEGDKVSVNGTLSAAVSAEDNGKKAVDFTVSGNFSAPYKVLYPGTTSENVISLPATQNYVADSFDGAAAAAYGNAVQSGEVYSAHLSNFCGFIRFALNGSATLDKIVLNSLGGEKLFGDFTLATDANGFTGAFTGGSEGSLTYDCDVTLSGTDTFFYIALPAQAYSAGIEALVYQADGAFMRLKFWGTGYTLAGNKIVAFASKAYAAGRTENLLSIGELTAEDGGEPTATPPSITVATYNVMRLDDDNRPAAATSSDSNGKIARPENAIVKDCQEMHVALGQAIYNLEVNEEKKFNINGVDYDYVVKKIELADF